MNETTKKGIETATRVLLEAGAKEVYIFGSAAQGTDTPDSDLDLAVSGLPPETFFATVGRLATTISRPFDLIDLDDPNPFTEYLERKGRLVRVA